MTHPPGQWTERVRAEGLSLFRESGLLDLPPSAREELVALAAVLTGGIRQLLRTRLLLPDPLAALVALGADVDQLRGLTRQWAESGAFGSWQGLAESTAGRLDEIAGELTAALAEARGAQ